MTLTSYDPERSPSPSEWLALPEGERIRLVTNFHQAKDRAKTHAIHHVVVENYLAQGFGPAHRALSRLLQRGMNRHDAVHALAEVIGRSYQLAVQAPDLQHTMLAAELEAIAIDADGEGHAKEPRTRLVRRNRLA